jgi:hypothetical protein
MQYDTCIIKTRWDIVANIGGLIFSLVYKRNRMHQHKIKFTKNLKRGVCGGGNNNDGNLEKKICSAKWMQFNVKTNEGGGNLCNGIGICPIASRLRT